MLENILGSTSKIKILRLFFEYPHRSFSTQDIFKDARVGVGYGLHCLKQLTAEGILRKRRLRRKTLYVLDKENKLYPLLNTLFEQERQAFPRISYTQRAILAEIIEKLQGNTLILFGSIAAGTATAESDIDLLVVGNDPEKASKKLRMIGKLNKIEIHGIALKDKELEEMITKKSPLIKSIAREKILLSGDARILEKIENV